MKKRKPTRQPAPNKPSNLTEKDLENTVGGTTDQAGNAIEGVAMSITDAPALLTGTCYFVGKDGVDQVF